MQVYAYSSSFQVGGRIKIGVKPGQFFGIAVYIQKQDGSLSFASRPRNIECPNISHTQTPNYDYFESPPKASSQRYDTDWNWDTITFDLDPGAHDSGVYAVVAYDIDPFDQSPIDAIGENCRARYPIVAMRPWTDAMALVVGRPRDTLGSIAYIVPTNTYHAYNSMGGGSFYEDYVHDYHTVERLTTRRPGGGFGGISGQPADPYDTATPRQEFAHWDQKFVRWLQINGFDCDYYTDLDLDRGNVSTRHYRCLVVAGHSEYWSRGMRDKVAEHIRNGGNFAVFGGNTCYCEIEYLDRSSSNYGVTFNRKPLWPVDDDETKLIGLSFKYGGGRWGEWKDGAWRDTGRKDLGFVVQRGDHWVFAGTGLEYDQAFGYQDRLVGYEADGTPPGSSAFKVLARSSEFTDSQTTQGHAAMGILGPDTDPKDKRGLVFNCGTTDWPRVLMDDKATSHGVVSRITLNVLKAFSAPLQAPAERDVATPR